LADIWDVFTLVPHDQREPKPDWVTKQYTYRQWRFPYLTDLNPYFVRAIHRALSQEDIDIVHGSKGTCTVKLVTRAGRETTPVYAAQNVEADHVRDFVSPDLPAYKRLLAPKLIPLVERLTVSCADAVTTVSEKDRERFIDEYDVNPDRIRAIPTGTETIDEANLEAPSTVRDRYGLGDRFVAVFHGYYGHYPNREAARLIDERIAPATREMDVEFLLVGKEPPAVSSPNVTAVGFVEDLYSVLRVADVAVVPICHGGGTKTKVYDYVTLGIPMITTEKGIEGIDLEPGTHALMTSDVDDGFVDRIQQVLTDREQTREISENLRSLADEWDWRRSTARLTEFYRAL
jgi:glycosyltransferase involved in cell wall biosynthesis